jgi:nitroimidazol reductase NimA-like FMN-containing flavoprotein (pyridoxamine 5'-phosphate oxidase superfamily)
LNTLERPEIRDGHRRLLAGFREFLEPIVHVGGPPDDGTLRGAVAFLRHGVMAFAHREEASLLDAGGPPEEAALEDVALEHAFLAGEIDRLDREVRRLAALPAGDPSRAACVDGIRRLAYRIEAVLEVHLLREEELEPGVPGARPVAAEGAGRPEIDSAQLERFLRRHRWATLCTVGSGQPYAVPVSYAFDGASFYLATGPGRKARNLEECPRVCLTVSEIAAADDWCSVVATGEARPVDGLVERMRALQLLARARGGSPGPADLARMARARVFRLAPDEISGRACGRTALESDRRPLTSTAAS